MDEIISFGGALGSLSLTIEPARPTDIPAILKFGSRLSLDTAAWRSLQEAGNVVVGKSYKGQIAGLCVANHYSLLYKDERFHDLRAALSVLCNRFKLSDSAIAFGAQVVIAGELEFNDLRSHLLRSLLRTVGLRYRHLFGFCRKDDPMELQALEREGWRCYQEEDEDCYLMLDVARALRGLATRLVMPLSPERSSLTRVAGHS